MNTSWNKWVEGINDYYWNLLLKICGCNHDNCEINDDDEIFCLNCKKKYKVELNEWDNTFFYTEIE